MFVRISRIRGAGAAQCVRDGQCVHVRVMPYSTDLSLLEGHTILSAENHPGQRFVLRLSDSMDLDIRVDDEGQLSIGIRVD